MRYAIGEFASMLGVTTDTLRLYEKHDIIKPVKDQHNNYRYFDDLDARNLLSSRWYRSMQIPLQQVADLVSDSSTQQVISVIAAAKERMEEELRRSAFLLDRVTAIHEELSGLEKRLNHCEVRQALGMYRIPQTSKNRLLQKQCMQEPVQIWMDLLPFTFFSLCITGISSLSSYLSDIEPEHSWGLAILEEDQLALGVQLAEGIEHVAAADCITSVIEISYDQCVCLSDVQFMLDYANEHGYVIGDELYGKLLVTERLAQGSRAYVEIYLPIMPSE